MFDRNKITIIQQDKDVPPANFLDWIKQLAPDMQVEVIFAPKQNLPTHISNALIILGGENNAYDDQVATWLSAEKQLIRDAISKQIPVFGICLGLQVATVATAGQVQVNHLAGQEIGVCRTYINAMGASDEMFSGCQKYLDDENSILLAAYHNDCVIKLPPQAKILASSTRCIQAVRYKSFFGTQFHPEVTVEKTKQWISQSKNCPHSKQEYEAVAENTENFNKLLLKNFLKTITN